MTDRDNMTDMTKHIKIKEQQIVKFKDTNNRLKLRLEQLMSCCCLNNFVWILILIADYCLYL